MGDDKEIEKGTIAATFLLKIMDHYKYKPYLLEPVQNMASALDLSDPMNMIPINIYKDICNWILENTGEINTRILGRELGIAAYHHLITRKMISVYASPIEAVEGLARLSGTMINDPREDQNWAIIKKGEKYMIVRRLKAFNSVMHLGLLESLVKKTGAVLPEVSFVARKEWGQPYDEYLISWI